MKDQHRTIKVFSVLIVAMTVGSFVLMSLDSQSLTEGPFSLSRTLKLKPIQNDVATGDNVNNWDGIEVYYNDDAVCDFDKLVRSSKSQLHFAVGNPAAGKEGVIKATRKWTAQKPCSIDLQQGQKIIRICIINDAGKSQPSNCQVSRATKLVEILCRLHNISPVRIRYPVNWQL